MVRQKKENYFEHMQHRNTRTYKHINAHTLNFTYTHTCIYIHTYTNKKIHTLTHHTQTYNNLKIVYPLHGVQDRLQPVHKTTRNTGDYGVAIVNLLTTARIRVSKAR